MIVISLNTDPRTLIRFLELAAFDQGVDLGILRRHIQSASFVFMKVYLLILLSTREQFLSSITFFLSRILLLRLLRLSTLTLKLVRQPEPLLSFEILSSQQSRISRQIWRLYLTLLCMIIVSIKLCQNNVPTGLDDTVQCIAVIYCGIPTDSIFLIPYDRA